MDKKYFDIIEEYIKILNDIKAKGSSNLYCRGSAIYGIRGVYKG